MKVCQKCYRPMEKKPRNKHIQKQKFLRYGGQEVGTEYCVTCYDEITGNEK